MKINKEDLKRWIITYNNGTIVDSEEEYLSFWRALEEICAFVIKKNKNNPEYYDLIQSMIMYILDTYIKNYREEVDGKETSPFAFLIQCAYYANLVVLKREYDYLRTETPAAVISGNREEREEKMPDFIDAASEKEISEWFANMWSKRAKVVIANGGDGETLNSFSWYLE